jgi:uncharacterized protein YcbX
MDATIRSIYRYPVKGLSAEKLDRVGLAAGQCLPHDRRFAIALDSTEFDPAHPEWLSKTHFIMLMRDAALARLSTHFDPQHGELSIAEDGKTLLRASLCEAEGCCRIARFFDEFMDGAVAGPLRIVEAPGHAFADAGGARLRVIAPITRCAATEVNPATAERDIPMVAELMRHFGHNLMGIYAEVLDPGDIATGDRLAA